MFNLQKSGILGALFEQRKSKKNRGKLMPGKTPVMRIKPLPPNMTNNLSKGKPTIVKIVFPCYCDLLSSPRCLLSSLNIQLEQTYRAGPDGGGDYVDRRSRDT